MHTRLYAHTCMLHNMYTYAHIHTHTHTCLSVCMHAKHTSTYISALKQCNANYQPHVWTGVPVAISCPWGWDALVHSGLPLALLFFYEILFGNLPNLWAKHVVVEQGFASTIVHCCRISLNIFWVASSEGYQQWVLTWFSPRHNFCHHHPYSGRPASVQAEPRNVYMVVESTGLQCSCFAGSSYSVAEEFTGPYMDLATGTFPESEQPYAPCAYCRRFKVDAFPG